MMKSHKMFAMTWPEPVAGRNAAWAQAKRGSVSDRRIRWCGSWAASSPGHVLMSI
jgi:hypothetical protein